MTMPMWPSRSKDQRCRTMRIKTLSTPHSIARGFQAGEALTRDRQRSPMRPPLLGKDGKSRRRGRRKKTTVRVFPTACMRRRRRRRRRRKRLKRLKPRTSQIKARPPDGEVTVQPAAGKTTSPKSSRGSRPSASWPSNGAGGGLVEANRKVESVNGCTPRASRRPQKKRVRSHRVHHTPSYGMVGSKNREFCSKHAKPGKIDVMSKRCGDPGCTTVPSYGMVGSKKRETCSKHAKPDMIDVMSKRCGHPGCTTIPYFGMVGS